MQVRKVNTKFATSLRMSKLIPLVTPQYKRDAVLSLCSELKLAIGENNERINRK